MGETNPKSIGSSNPTQFKNLFVKGFDKSMDNSELHKIFRRFGQIASAVVVTDEYGDSLGYGYVSFFIHADAATALQKMNGFCLNGYSLLVTIFKNQSERMQERYYDICLHGSNVYVKNLHPSIDDDELTDLFKPYGKITSAKVQLDPSTQESKMFGYVCFKTPEEASKAITELNHTEYKTKTLAVCLFVPNKIRREVNKNQGKACSKAPHFASSTCLRKTSDDFIKQKEFGFSSGYSLHQYMSNTHNGSFNQNPHYQQPNFDKKNNSFPTRHNVETLSTAKQAKKSMVAPFAASFLSEKNRAGKNNMQDSSKRRRLPLAANFDSAVVDLSYSSHPIATKSSKPKTQTGMETNKVKHKHSKSSQKAIFNSVANVNQSYVSAVSMSEPDKGIFLKGSSNAKCELPDLKQQMGELSLNNMKSTVGTEKRPTSKNAYLRGNVVNIKAQHCKKKDSFP